MQKLAGAACVGLSEMRAHKQIAGAVLPLFDRLTDDAPRVPAEAVPKRILDEDGLADSVASEVQTLLNTRCPLSEGDIDYAERSVIDYGLVDISPYFTLSVEGRRALSKHIAKTIAAYEPRLSKISVTIARVAHETGRLEVRIDGVARSGTVTVPVSFPVLIRRDDS